MDNIKDKSTDELQKELRELQCLYNDLKVLYDNEIIRQNRTKDLLKNKNSKLELAIQAANMAWWEMDMTTGKVTFEDKKAEMLGYQPEEFTNYKDFMNLVHPEDNESTMNSMRALLNGDADKYETEYRILTKSAGYKWFFDIGTVVKRDTSGKPETVTGLVVDITNRKHAEELLIASETRYRRLFETAKDGILILDAETGMIMDVNPYLIDLMEYTVDQFLKKTIWEIGYFKEIIGDKDKYLELRQNNYTRYDDLPLETATGKKINIEFVSNVYLVNNREVVQCNIRDVTARKRSDDALHKSEAHQRILLQTIPDLIWLKDTNGVYLSCNAMFERFFGASEADIIGKTDYDFVNRELADSFREHESVAMAAGKSSSNEEWITFADDGHRAFLETIKTPVCDLKGNIIGLLGVGRDLTERRHAEEALRKSEELFKTVFEKAPIAIALIDIQGRPLISNLPLSEMVGYNADELSKMKFTDFTYEEDIEKDMTQFVDLIEGRISSYSMEKRYVHKQGNIVWANLYVTMIRDKTGQPKEIIGMVEDITERKKTENALIESEIKYRAFFENSMDAILLTSPADGQTLSANQAACSMFGYSEAELLKIGRAGIQDPMDVRLPVLLEERKLLGNVRGEVTFIRKDGTRFPAEISSSIIKKQGGLDYSSLIIHDISERKRSEKESLMLAHSLKSINECVSITDLDNKILFINQSFSNTYGYTSDELIGKNINVVRAQTNNQKRVEEILPATILGEWQGELMNRRKDDTEFPVYLSTTKITDKDGAILGLIGVSKDISEQRQALETLNENEVSLRNAQEIAKMGSWEYDMVNYKTKWSENVFVLFGLKPCEIEPQFEFFRSIIVPDDLPVLDKIAKDILISRQTADFEIRILLPDGTIKWLQNRFVPVFINEKLIKIKGIILDINERKNAEEKLRKLSSAVEQTLDTIVITDFYGTIEYVNRAFENKTGYSFYEALGKTPGILKSGKHNQEFYKEIWKTILSGNVFREDIINRKKNGDYYEEEKTISPLFNNSGVLTHFVGTGVDITKRKQAEKELIEAKEKAEESDRLKSAFLTNMSHEIRTPMNGILGFTSLLKEPKLSGEEQQEYINIIEKAGKRMLNIINDIIDFSKIESGLTDVTISTTDVNEQIEYIHSFFKPEATQKGIKLICSKSLPAHSASISTDKEKVYAILTNLIKNAIKYTNAGSIEFGCEIKGKFLRYFVKDTGIGIYKDKMKIIFERFRQASESHTRDFEGAGLGLSISKAYAEMLGGQIWAESEEGKGSTFFVTIPYNVDTEVSIMESKDIVTAKPVVNPEKLNILIAEDDTTSEMLVRIVLSPYSSNISDTTTGIGAVEICRNNPDIDLILMDVKMPDMDGFEAARQIRRFNKNVVIIAQTAFGSGDYAEKAVSSGCNDYITKPIDIVLLKSLIQKHFGK